MVLSGNSVWNATLAHYRVGSGVRLPAGVSIRRFQPTPVMGFLSSIAWVTAGANRRGLSGRIGVGSRTVGYALQHGEGWLSQRPGAERLTTPHPVRKTDVRQGAVSRCSGMAAPFRTEAGPGKSRAIQIKYRVVTILLSRSGSSA